MADLDEDRRIVMDAGKVGGWAAVVTVVLFVLIIAGALTMGLEPIWSIYPLGAAALVAMVWICFTPAG